MHVSITRTHDPRAQPAELATITGEEMLPWLREIDGFEGLLMLSSPENGTTLVLTFWQSEEIAEKHSEARRQFRDSITSAVNVQVVETSGYDLTFAHLGPWAGSGEAG